MPIYEFYCPDCHAVYSFLSRRVRTDKVPACPRCRRPRLDRQVSLFAATGRARGDEDGDLPVDDDRMERAMALLEKEADGLDDEDPRKAAGLMRRFSDATGLELGRGMEEALGRLEAGEDPDKVEDEMGDSIESDEEPFLLPGRKGRDRSLRRRPPRRDPTLYDL